MKHLKTFESISISNKDLDDYANMSKVQKYKDEILFKSYVDLLFKHKDKWDYIYDTDFGTFSNVISNYNVDNPKLMLQSLIDYGKTDDGQDLLFFIEAYFEILKDTLSIEDKLQELIDIGLIVRFGRDTQESDTKYLRVEVFQEDYDTLSTDKVLEIFEALIFIKVRLDFKITSITTSEIVIEIRDIKS